jgi:hypothetical protein
MVNEKSLLECCQTYVLEHCQKPRNNYLYKLESKPQTLEDPASLIFMSDECATFIEIIFDPYYVNNGT